MIAIPEPDGARMQVVKGFSTLTFDYLQPRLPRPRRNLVAVWPKWDGESRWVFRYLLGDIDELAQALPCVLGSFDGRGEGILIFYAGPESRIVAEHPFVLSPTGGDEPYRTILTIIAEAFVEPLVAHLHAMTRLESQPSP